jgi:hypothetical protein
MTIMPNTKLYILITYMFLGPSAPWAHGSRLPALHSELVLKPSYLPSLSLFLDMVPRH